MTEFDREGLEMAWEAMDRHAAVAEKYKEMYEALLNEHRALKSEARILRAKVTRLSNRLSKAAR